MAESITYEHSPWASDLPSAPAPIMLQTRRPQIRGARDHSYPQATRQNQYCTSVQYPEGPPQIQSPHRRRRPPRSARGRRHPPISMPRMGPPRDSVQGGQATYARELLVVTILHSCAVSQGGRDLQADFVRLANRCFGAYGTAADGSVATPGHPSSNTPICARFIRCATEKVRQWTERPGKTLHLPLQNGHFGNPSKKSPEAT
jgi:hypothetical protein